MNVKQVKTDQSGFTMVSFVGDQKPSGCLWQFAFADGAALCCRASLLALPRQRAIAAPEPRWTKYGVLPNSLAVDGSRNHRGKGDRA